MATFPSLKTSAVAQYPAKRYFQFQNQTLRFLDGTEQRYRDSAGPLLRWELRLDQLDEGELAAMDEFFSANRGMCGTFEFTDPWDGRLYKNCSLETDGLDLTIQGEMQGTTRVAVVENR